MSTNDTKDTIGIKMFGFFDILYHDESIFFDVGSSAKSLDILKFLLAQKGVVFLPETIAESVWPENDYLDQKKVVRTYIHRLRRILNSENKFGKDFSEQIMILNVKGSYKLELSDEVELDTETFQSYCVSIIQENETEKLLSLFNLLIDIYSRNFLEDNRLDEWVTRYRNYFLRSFCAAVSNILGKLEAEKRFETIIELCEKSLKIYDLDENINIYFLNALIETDKINSAIQHYSFITAKTNSTLSIPISERMKNIYKRMNPDRIAEPSHPPIESFDTGKLRSMVNEIINETLNDSAKKYSVGLVRLVRSKLNSPIVLPKNEDDNVIEHLEYALELALRKNDMYAIADKRTAIIVLSDAREEFFTNISGRICSAFYERYGGVYYKLETEIFPVKLLKDKK